MGLIEEVRARRSLPPPTVAEAIRRAANITRSRMADELGVHRVTIQRWEEGTRRPTGRHALAYAELLAQLQDVTSS